MKKGNPVSVFSSNSSFKFSHGVNKSNFKLLKPLSFQSSLMSENDKKLHPKTKDAPKQHQRSRKDERGNNDEQKSVLGVPPSHVKEPHQSLAELGLPDFANFPQDLREELKLAEKKSQETMAMIEEAKSEIAAYQKTEKENGSNVNIASKTEMIVNNIAALQEVSEKVKRTRLDQPNFGLKTEEGINTDIGLSLLPIELTDRSDNSDENLRQIEESETSEVPSSFSTHRISQSDVSDNLFSSKRDIESTTDFRNTGRSEDSAEHGISCLEQELKSLKDHLMQACNTKDCLEKENKCLEESRYQLQEELIRKDSQIEELEQKMMALQLQVDQMQKDKEHFAKKRTAYGTDLEIPDPMDDEITKMKQEILRLKGEVAVMQTAREEMTLKNVKRLEASLSCARENKDSQEKGRLIKEIETQTLRYHEIAKKLENVEDENAELKDRLKMVTESYKKDNAELANIKAQLVSLQDKNGEFNSIRDRVKTYSEDVEELHSQLEEKDTMIEDYKDKYLQAQQRVEELMRENHERTMDIEVVRNSCDTEIKSIRAQCLEKMSKMEEMSMGLKQTQEKLQKSVQKNMLQEQKVDDLKNQISNLMETSKTLQEHLDLEKRDRALDVVEKERLEKINLESKKTINELKTEISEMKTKLVRMEQTASHLKHQCEEKNNEIIKNTTVLEEAKADAARYLARQKERSEATRRALQSNLSDMERELARTRASVKAAQKERDEVRQRLQSQINTLTESLEEGQFKWKGLQAHVAYLQSSLLQKQASARSKSSARK